MRILLVDDELDYILILKRNLTKTANELLESGHMHNYHIRAVTNPAIVLSTIFPIPQNQPQHDPSYDLIFMDTNMLTHKGYDICLEIIQECKHKEMGNISIIGMSSLQSDINVEEWRKAGAGGFYDKNMLINLNNAGSQPGRFMLPGKTVLEGILLQHTQAIPHQDNGPKSHPGMYSSANTGCNLLTQ